MAMLACEVVTPTKQIFSGAASEVIVPSSGGSMGILPGHEMFACRMKNGVVTVYTDETRSTKIEFVTYMGFTEVSADRVIVLAREGILLEDIKVAEVTAKRDELKAKIDALSEGDLSTQNERAARIHRGTIKDELQWCETQLAAVANR